MAATSLISLKSASVARLKLLALVLFTLPFVVMDRDRPAPRLLDTIFFATDGEACGLVFIDRL